MRRRALHYLQEWLVDKRRKPLVLRGARQVGKTWLVHHLAKTQHKKLIELNFEKNPEYQSFFQTNEPKKILRNIELEMGITINPRDAILFFDEIQIFPQLLAKLRWFYELHPALPVIAAGSLLDFVLSEHEFSMPVGRINYLHLEPLSFEEFLLAKKLENLVTFLKTFQLKEKISEAIHKKLLGLFQEYIIVGGMPYAVATWIETQSLSEVAKAHGELLLTYRDDFAKYAGNIATVHLEEVLRAIPNLLGKKFIFSHINRDIKKSVLKQALDLLCKARVCYKITATSANGLPLMAEIDDKRFKVNLLDVGLVSNFLGLRLDHIESIDDINLINQGAISEQVVGQLLRCAEPLYAEAQNFYWSREEKNANAEIDFVMQCENQLIPLEVKSGKTGSLKSLHLFMHLKKRVMAARINSDMPSVVSVDVQLHNHHSVQYQLLSIPFYFTEQLKRLLSEAQS